MSRAPANLICSYVPPRSMGTVFHVSKKFTKESVLPIEKDVIVAEGIVIEALPDALFRVELQTKGEEKPTVLCHLSGKMRINRIRILQGDRVLLEMSPYDLAKGRITRRL